MNNEYLWDGRGEPDEEIQKLEGALSVYRHQGAELKFPATLVVRPASRWRKWVPFTRWQLLSAGTAAVVVCVAFAILLWPWNKTPSAGGPGWGVERVMGAPQVEFSGAKKSHASSELRVGQTLVTDDRSRASITEPQVGTISVEPNTRLRLIARTRGRDQLALERGTIHAFIWAQPGEFAVDTPSALAVDLGCAYTLHVDDSGAGTLRTTLGWVGFKLGEHESFIPAGAACETHPKRGPGTPYFEDASASFREALAKFDFAADNPAQRDGELDVILKEARPRDALSLWHLLARTEAADRGRVYDRLASLVAPPAAVTREGILSLDRNMLDAWWNELGLGDISLWRTWERSWPKDKS